jgi:hypothetical protein
VQELVFLEENCEDEKSLKDFGINNEFIVQVRLVRTGRPLCMSLRRTSRDKKKIPSALSTLLDLRVPPTAIRIRLHDDLTFERFCAGDRLCGQPRQAWKTVQVRSPDPVIVTVTVTICIHSHPTIDEIATSNELRCVE